MKLRANRLILALILIFSMVSFAEAGIDFGISLGDDGLEGFYLSVGDYYKVPQREVIIIKERRIPDEEIPVVLYIAKRANVTPKTVMNLRIGGKSWMDITLHFGLSPEIFYVPVKEVNGPPYGKAYGHFRKNSNKKGKSIILGDDDVINFVNLKFTSEYYNCSPEEVIRMREEGRSFVEINGKVRKAKGKQNANNKQEEKVKVTKQRGKKKGKF